MLILLRGECTARRSDTAPPSRGTTPSAATFWSPFMKPVLRAALACFLVLTHALAPARAELPSIRFDRLQPIGVSAGSELEVTAVGRDVEDVQTLLFDRPGLTAEFVKPTQFKIKVAADVPEGTYDVRLLGKYGVSNSRQLAVTHGLADVLETEPNNTAGESQPVALNSAVNGMSDGNGQDCFRFPARKGARIIIDCQAARLDSPLDANLILSTAGGQILANNGDYYGRDPFIDFVAPEDGEYVATVHDLSYRGGFPYRLLITDRPQIENVFPRAVEAGKPIELTAFGRNLHPGRPPASVAGELPLDELKFTVTPPGDLAGGYVFIEHPTEHSVLPTAATFTLTGYQVRVPVNGGALRAGLLMVTDGPLVSETEPNTRETPQPLPLPVVVSGRFNQARDADWFEITAAESGSYSVDVYSERIGGRADPYVMLYDDKDNLVTELDDAGPRVSAFDGHLRDPSGSFNLQDKRKYKLMVQDRYSRGGPRYQYVLAIRKPVPDFQIASIHSENPGPSGLNLWRGGAEYLDLIINQQGGFNGPITVTAAGLPPGVHAAPTVINNNTRGTFVLWSDADAAPWHGPIQLVATAQSGEQTLQHTVRPYTRVWADANPGSSRPTRELTLGLQNEAPYALKIMPDKVTVTAGQKAELKLSATRYWPDFKGKINVVPLNLPGNFSVGNTEIPADQTEISLPIMVQANTRPGEYTLTVQGQAQVPFNKDPQAAAKPNTLVSSPAQPVTITVVAPPKNP